MMDVLVSEWTKMRTVRSTWWALAAAPAAGGGLAWLLGLSFRHQLDAGSSLGRGPFDPLFGSFYVLTLAQLALVVFAVLVAGGEYSSGTIRASLAATPRRGVFYAGKVLGAALPLAAVSLLTVIAAFVAGQAALGPHAAWLGGDAWRAITGSWLYLTLISLFALGVAMVLRGPALSLGVLLPVLFLNSQGLGNVPAIRAVTQYLPDQAGTLIMHVAGPPDHPAFPTSYGPWTGTALLAAWAAVALTAGYLLLRDRDAT
ncbi:ABC transporter permease [Sphaerisporangium fuscum]|uniref:ABC transporter permease n=1 Tax=Sphaerisporangium fuscum TaxID=2835868 RepID=UPI001BDC2834|nr:ABC transporter permease [Sphaerisporangium fuscum]